MQVRIIVFIIVAGAMAGIPMFTQAGLAGATANQHPDGTLVKTANHPDIYYIKNATRSKIIRPIVDRWLGEAHYLNHDLIVRISNEEMRSYKRTVDVNPYYVGKILKRPSGEMYFIDTKRQRRPISDGVRKALGFSGRNIYSVSSFHIKQFPLAPTVTRTNVHPDGTVMYRGAYHGGSVWLVQNGKKRYFHNDYIYEAMGFAWSSQIVPVSATELARYSRGQNIDTYPDGYMVKDSKGRVYVTKSSALRWIASGQILDKMRYNKKYIFGNYQELLKNYKNGDPITSFAGITVKPTSIPKPGKAGAGISKFGTKASLISRINSVFREVYDREITPAENRYWVTYIYDGHANSELELRTAMQKKARVKGVSTSAFDELESMIPDIFSDVFSRSISFDEAALWTEKILSGAKDTMLTLVGAMEFSQIAED